MYLQIFNTNQCFWGHDIAPYKSQKFGYSNVHRHVNDRGGCRILFNLPSVGYVRNYRKKSKVDPYFYILRYKKLSFSFTSRNVHFQSYEEIAEKAYGPRGKMINVICITIHTMGAMCSFLFICKYELPPVVKMLFGIDPCENTLWTNGDFLVFLTVVFIVGPLAAAKDISFLGYTSGLMRPREHSFPH